MIIGFMCLVVAALVFHAILARSRPSSFFDGIGFIGMLACGLCAIFYAYAAYNWIGSEYKANIINREYGTNYTQAEVFYASDVIDTVRELDRKRIELNGDLLREEPEK